MLTSELHPSQWLKGEDLRGKTVRARISKVTLEVVKGDKGDKTKPVLHFVEGKPMILNVENTSRLEDAFGPDTDLWIGCLVELYFDPSVSFGGKRVGGLRLRPAARPAQEPEVEYDEEGTLIRDSYPDEDAA